MGNLTQRRGRKGRGKTLPLVNQNAAGVDIGSREHWVAVPQDRDEEPVRKFRCYTNDLQEMADWLEKCGITTVAMESTGVYWIPVHQILERRGITVVLSNAQHIKNVPGRKTDMLDCQWIQRLHSFGLISGSFRPEDAICVIRSFWRHRQNLVRYAASHIQQMQKALIQMNVQLHKAVSDITGKTGMAIIRAMLQGERDAQRLAAMRDRNCERSVEELAAALTGDYREEHLFVLKQSVDCYDFYQAQIQQCDQGMIEALAKFETKVDVSKVHLKPPRRKNSKNSPPFEMRDTFYAISGVDFTQIDGLNISSVTTILSEVGIDPTLFPSAKHFTSWLGLCPNRRITGGKVKSSRTRPVVNRAATAFRQAAMGLTHANCALGGYYRRMKVRLGGPAAITATAHKLARIFYCLWSKGGSYADRGADYYEIKYRDRIITNMRKKAKQLGLTIEFKPLPA
jgi:transposase